MSITSSILVFFNHYFIILILSEIKQWVSVCLSYNEFSSEIISNNLNTENSTRPPSVLFN